MNIDSLERLAAWGFNVPKFVLSPGKHFKRDAIHILRELFLRSESVHLLAERQDGVVCKDYPDLSIPDAYMRSQALEESFYRTAIVETIPWDMEGLVLFESGSTGFVEWTAGEGANGRFKFAFVEAIPDLVLRHIVRECERVCDSVRIDQLKVFVRVDWQWAKDFLGVSGSRLVIHNFNFA